MPKEQRVNPQMSSRDVEVEGAIGTLADVGGGAAVPEIEVDRIEQTVAQRPGGPRQVVIRVNEDIEEMSYLSGGRRETYTFQTGHRYKVPVHIARELEALGKVWH